MISWKRSMMCFVSCSETFSCCFAAAPNRKHTTVMSTDKWPATKRKLCWFIFFFFLFHCLSSLKLIRFTHKPTDGINHKKNVIMRKNFSMQIACSSKSSHGKPKSYTFSKRHGTNRERRWLGRIERRKKKKHTTHRKKRQKRLIANDYRFGKGNLSVSLSLLHKRKRRRKKS